MNYFRAMEILNKIRSDFVFLRAAFLVHTAFSDWDETFRETQDRFREVVREMDKRYSYHTDEYYALEREIIALINGIRSLQDRERMDRERMESRRFTRY